MMHYIGYSDSRSIPMMLQDLYTAFATTNNGKSIDEMKKILQIMSIEDVVVCSQNTEFNGKASSNAVSYMVNIGIILNKLKQRTIHDIICERYGVQSGVYSIILMNRGCY